MTDPIYKLIEIVSPSKIKNLAIINCSKKVRTKIDHLYKILTEEEDIKEGELIEKLFGKTSLPKGNFNRTKRQLEERLINTLFLIDVNQSKYYDFAQAYYACYKYAAAVKILLGKKKGEVAMILAEKTFKIAEKFEFTDILLGLGKDLRRHYASIIGDSRKYSYYNNKTKYYTEVYLAELMAEEYYSELAHQFSISRASKAEYLDKAVQNVRELEEIINKYNTYQFKLHAYTVMAIQFEITDDHENTIKVCNNALRFFAERSHIATETALHTFYFRKIPSLILLGRLEEAELATEKCILLKSLALHNWYQTQVYRYIIFLHSDQYEKAYQVYKEAIGHSNFSKQYPNIKEAWYIYEAYTYYFCLKKVIKGALNDRLKKFRLNKFLNEVPNYSKDKRGMNISILIIQVLFFLHQKEYGKIIDRAEALRTYTHRYLRKDATFRSNCFIKMLLQLPNANFHKAAVERKTADLRKKLSSVGIINNQSAELEIIPYEILWELVMSSLDNKIWYK